MRLRARIRTVLALAMVAVLVACGGDDGSGNGNGATGGGSGGSTEPAGGSGSEELTTVRVGLLPITDVAPVYLGVEQGFFEEEGLELEIAQGQGGAALIPALVSGDLEFGYTNVASVMLAVESGIDVRLVSNGASVGEHEETTPSVIAVKEGSGISSAADLHGKKVAVNTLAGIAQVIVQHAISQAGGDPEQIEFVELPFPEMQAALERDTVDAVSLAEPFNTLVLDGAGEVLIDLYATLDPITSLAAYAASGSYIDDNPEVAAAFARAMNRSLEYARENSQEARDILQEFTELDEDIRNRVVLWDWVPELTVDSLREFGELATEYELLKEEPDYEALIWSEA